MAGTCQECSFSFCQLPPVKSCIVENYTQPLFLTDFLLMKTIQEVETIIAYYRHCAIYTEGPSFLLLFMSIIRDRYRWAL